MAEHISTFPVLTDDLFNSIGYSQNDLMFYYVDDEGEKCPLEEIDDTFLHVIFDRKGKWSPDSQYGLFLEQEITIETPSLFFGKDGIAPRNSEIGLGLRWCSNQSNQRGTIIIGTIRDSDSKIILPYSYHFDKCQLRGDVNFTVIFYINNVDSLAPEEQFLASTKGMIIGELTPYVLKLDGKQTQISISFFEDIHGPLWRLDGDCPIPYETSFDKNAFTISINTKHADFAFVDHKNKHFNVVLFREIIASAFTLFIDNLRILPNENNLDSFRNNRENILPGSVAENILMFEEELGMVFSTPVETAKSMRIFLDKELIL